MKSSVLLVDTSSCKALSIFLLIIFTLTPLPFSYAVDIINPGQNLTDGQSLVSSGGVFELEFFTPGNSSRNWYLGLWYRNLAGRTYVWVANRDAPLTNTTGFVLRVVQPGILVLVNSSDGVVWSTNTSRSVQNPVAQILDSGNLVVRDRDDERPENFLWQSFEHPTDTYLPGMKMGWNLKTGLETFLVSWTSDDDPATGNYSWHLDLHGYPQLVLKWGPGTDDLVYRFGPWNGIRISGLPDSPAYRTFFVLNENEAYYRSEPIDSSIAAGTGIRIRYYEVQRLTWVNTKGWVPYLTNPADSCDTFRVCSENQICDVRNSPSCGCLDKFVPRNSSDPSGRNGGCRRRTNLSCEGDIFTRYASIKLPDTRNAWYNMNMTIDECRAECLRNCTCIAYTQLDLSRQIGCLFWYGDLIDVKRLTTSYGQDIFIRLASSEAEADHGGRKRRILVASLVSVIGLVLICLSLFLYCRKRNRKIRTVKEEPYSENQQKEHSDSELPWLDLATILKATDNFSSENKLGEGGFGPVYKGILEDGKEIAVKRLSKNSKQGLGELKNEVKLIAKLQHRNLVQLLGCCIEETDNMLVYEYMPNKSLDGILFDKTKGKLLDWPTRFKIINGIARGLMYLHQDSRLRVIHRDLKASNILLDKDMTPKISDFGLARSFGGNELEANTKRVIGTYGYMSPEYAIDGLFSAKSDVFSFGVLVLEIVTGKRNRGFSHSEHQHNLLGHAWILYKEGRSLELIDRNIEDSCSLSDVIKPIQVGLLCVQAHSEDRPTMSSVVFMMENEVELPEPKEPGFFSERAFLAHDTSTATNTASGPNELTISIIEGR